MTQLKWKQCVMPTVPKLPYSAKKTADVYKIKYTANQIETLIYFHF